MKYIIVPIFSFFVALGMTLANLAWDVFYCLVSSVWELRVVGPDSTKKYTAKRHHVSPFYNWKENDYSEKHFKSYYHFIWGVGCYED